MGVYIKGMEMPKAGVYSCELGVLDKNTAVLTIYTPIEKPQRSFKLVPVSTPHGRLIDADALYDHVCKTHDKWRENPQTHMSINPFTDDETMVLYAPTVIPASEEGE